MRWCIRPSHGHHGADILGAWQEHGKLVLKIMPSVNKPHEPKGIMERESRGSRAAASHRGSGALSGEGSRDPSPVRRGSDFRPREQ